MSVSLDSLLQEALTKKLNDGSIEQLVSDKIDGIIGRAIDDALSWSSPAYKELKEKVQKLMSHCIERSSFDDYVLKITEVIDIALANSSAAGYKKINDNIKALFDDSGTEFLSTIKFADIIDRYEKFLQEFYGDSRYRFNDADIIEDGDSEYGYVNMDYTVEIRDLSRTYSSFREYEITMYTDLSEEDTETKVNFILRGNVNSEEYRISMDTDWKISEINNLNSVLLYLLRASKNMCKIKLTTEDVSEDFIQDTVCVEFTGS